MFPFNSFPQPNGVAQWRNMFKRYLKINVEFKSWSSFIWIFTHISVSIFWKCLCAIALKYYICVMPGFVCAFSHTMKDCMKYKTKTKRALKVKMRAGKACKKTWGVRVGCEDEFILGFRWSLMKIGLSQFKGLLWPSRPLEPLFVQGLLQQNSFQVLPFPRPPPPYLFPHLHLGN